MIHVSSDCIVCFIIYVRMIQFGRRQWFCGSWKLRELTIPHVEFFDSDFPDCIQSKFLCGQNIFFAVGK